MRPSCKSRDSLAPIPPAKRDQVLSFLEYRLREEASMILLRPTSNVEYAIKPMIHHRPSARHGIEVRTSHIEQLHGALHLMVSRSVVITANKVVQCTIQAIHVNHLPHKELPKEGHECKRPLAVCGLHSVSVLLASILLGWLQLSQDAEVLDEGAEELPFEGLGLRLSLAAFGGGLRWQLWPSRIQRDDDVGALLEILGLLQGS
mmetsp:Transcript_37316/g.107546  ORF Transcript_37316/g.107546 Transcript_37316/m.107546 type:complete len:204 (+) Transcript_37316:236-847(+)